MRFRGRDYGWMTYAGEPFIITAPLTVGIKGRDLETAAKISSRPTDMAISDLRKIHGLTR